MYPGIANDNFRIELNGTIAEVIVGPAGGMPVTDAQGHACLAAIWPLLGGVAKAKYYLLTCEAVSGSEAERIGLLSKAVPETELLDQARTVAQGLARGSATALMFTKRTINHWLRSAMPAFEHSLAAELYGFTPADAQEGLAALQQKRAAQFE